MTTILPVYSFNFSALLKIRNCYKSHLLNAVCCVLIGITVMMNVDCLHMASYTVLVDAILYNCFNIKKWCPSWIPFAAIVFSIVHSHSFFCKLTIKTNTK